MFYLYVIGGIVAYLVVGFVVICLIESDDEIETAANDGPLGLLFWMAFFTLIWPLTGTFIGLLTLIDRYNKGWSKFKKRLTRIDISFRKESE